MGIFEAILALVSGNSGGKTGSGSGDDIDSDGLGDGSASNSSSSIADGSSLLALPIAVVNVTLGSLWVAVHHHG